MKRAFTLVELLVVIIIIGIILGAFAYLMVGYQKKLAFKTDIMKFEDSFFIWDKIYSAPQKESGTWGIFLIKKGDWFDVGVGSFYESEMESKTFRVARLENISFEGRDLEEAKLVKYPYEIACPLKDEDGNFKKGDLSFKFVWVSKDYCGNINLNTCKLTILKCVD